MHKDIRSFYANSISNWKFSAYDHYVEMINKCNLDELKKNLLMIYEWKNLYNWLYQFWKPFSSSLIHTLKTLPSLQHLSIYFYMPHLPPSLPSPAFLLFHVFYLLFLKQFLDTELSVGQKDKRWSGVYLLCKNN